jgi:hypothetical protein
MEATKNRNNLTPRDAIYVLNYALQLKNRKRYIFSIDQNIDNIIEVLNNNTSNKLVEYFGKNIYLEQPKVEKIEENQKWEIRDKEKQYLIEKENIKLNIYRKRIGDAKKIVEKAIKEILEKKK